MQKTKLNADCMLHDFGVAHGFNRPAVRYFNASGRAILRCETAEAHEPNRRLTPIMIKVMLGKRDRLTV